MRKTFYWYHEPDEAIHVMVKLKQVVVPYIEFIQGNNTTNNLPSRFKVYTDMNPNLFSEHNHQMLLDKIEARENLNHCNIFHFTTYFFTPLWYLSIKI